MQVVLFYACVSSQIYNGEIRYAFWHSGSAGKTRLLSTLWLLQLTVDRAKALGRTVPDVEMIFNIGDNSQGHAGVCSIFFYIDHIKVEFFGSMSLHWHHFHYTLDVNVQRHRSLLKITPLFITLCAQGTSGKTLRRYSATSSATMLQFRSP